MHSVDISSLLSAILILLEKEQSREEYFIVINYCYQSSLALFGNSGFLQQGKGFLVNLWVTFIRPHWDVISPQLLTRGGAAHNKKASLNELSLVTSNTLKLNS